MRKFAIALLFVLLSINSFAIGELYIVKPHDTLWDISKRFYKNPFYWGKIWKNNQYINDPNLIFPGEILRVGKHGLEIYSGEKKKVKAHHYEKYLSAVWFDGIRFFSACGKGYCNWFKRDFRIARISFDTYEHSAVTIGDTVYLHTDKNYLPKIVYVYRSFKDRMYTKLCPPEYEIFIPVGVIVVEKKLKKGVFQGKIIKAAGEIEQGDVVSSVYPYEVVEKSESARVGNKRVNIIMLVQDELEGGLGYFIFFKASKPLPLLVGKKVEVARLNSGSPVPITVAKGIVVSQYKSYIGLYVPIINGLYDIPDRTQQYILR